LGIFNLFGEHKKPGATLLDPVGESAKSLGATIKLPWPEPAGGVRLAEVILRAVNPMIWRRLSRRVF
jgi:hypothetical protein